jgi:O-antigen/teichoic acid export membrane protein
MTRFAREAAIYAFGNVGLRLASLLLTPVYTYSFSVGDYGLWATLQITIQALLIAIGMGMRETSMRFTKQHEDDSTVGALLGTTTVLVLAGGIVVTGAICLFMQPLFSGILHRQDVLELLGLTCLAALAQALAIQLMSYYRATGRPARYMSVGLFGAVLLLATTLPAVALLDLGIRGALWAYILTYALVSAAVALDILPATGFRIAPSLAPRLLSFGLPMVVSAIGQFALGATSVYLLSYFAGLESVAVYSLGLRFSLLMSVGVSLPFQLAFQPYLYGNLDNPKVKCEAGRLLTYLMLGTTFTASGLLVLAYLILPLVAPPAYSDAFPVLLLLLPGQALLGAHYFGETLIGAVRKTHLLGAINAFCALLGLALGVVLIPRLGWLGAILATSAAGFLSSGTVLGVGLRAFRLGREIERLRLCVVGLLFVAQLVLAFWLSREGRIAFLGGMTLFLLMGLALLAPFATFQERAALRSLALRAGLGRVVETSLP